MSIPAAILWGVLNGMIMIRSVDARFRARYDISSYGVRCHAWFRFYHRMLALMGALATATAVIGYPLLFSAPVAVAGLAVLCWGLFEAFYSWARFARFVPDQENVLGSGKYVRGRNVVFLSLARLAIGAALLARGVL